MAPKPRYLSSVSRSGPDPVIEFTGEQFAKLEVIYGESLSPEARRTLTDHANTYLSWKLTELNAVELNSAVKLLSRVKKHVAPFVRFAFGEFVGSRTDEAQEISSVLENAYASQPLALRPGSLKAADDFDQALLDRIKGPLWIELNDRFLMNFGIALQASLHIADREMLARKTSGSHGFAPGEAFQLWLYQMREWAQKNGLSADTRATDRESPSRFSECLFELNSMFATASLIEEFENYHFPDNVASASALAERLKELITKTNKRSRNKMGD